MTQQEIVLNKPDDMHLHLRDGDMLSAVVEHSARDFARAIVMPNLVPPVTTVEDATRYRQRILDALGSGTSFEPLMTLYLTESTTAGDLEKAAASNIVKAVKLYPAGATTNSDSGVRDIAKSYHLFEKMAELDLPLLVHGEVTDDDIDIFDREAVFIDRVLDPIRRTIPELRIVMEHVTTKDGVDYVGSAGNNLFATLTTHHLMLNRNAMLVGGIRPHYYCLPILKREEHRQALRAAATSGDARFFLGTDSAPHTTYTKENACGCAGVFSAANSLGCLATVFEEEQALENLNAFTSVNGAKFYGLDINDAKMRLVRTSEPAVFPQHFKVGAETVTVFDPGKPIYWHVDHAASL
ncbi:dihydroorotase [Falsihalocynthiibacter arcticus]|uniref:dihydroorotase n=1 Tax=Falsihalocynthiibacter arcticus TaxID=1579316 RepID=UPI003001BAFD